MELNGNFLKQSNRRIKWPLTVVTLLLPILPSCQTNQWYEIRKQRLAKAELFFKHSPVVHSSKETTYDLESCWQLTLKENYQLKILALREKIATERKNASLLGMLPDLQISAERSRRDNTSGANSEGIRDGQESLRFSRSRENSLSTFSVRAVFSVLDFGLSYYSALQSDNKRVQQIYENKRTIANLKLEMIQAYYALASLQQVLDKVKQQLIENEKTLTELDELKDNELLDPIHYLEMKKDIIEDSSRMREVIRSHSNASLRLSGLMGVKPTSNLTVDLSDLEFERGSLKATSTSEELFKAEKIALLNRPEFFISEAQVSSAHIEARKTLLKLFPNVNLFASANGSTNKYLYNQSWWDIGLEASYNLLNAPALGKEYKAWKKEAQAEELNQLNLSIAVITQVHMAYANLSEVRDRVKFHQQFYAVSKLQKETAHELMDKGELSRMELLRISSEETLAEVQMLAATANFCIAKYQILNVTGRLIGEEESEGLEKENIKNRKDMIQQLQKSPVRSRTLPE